MAGLSAEAQNMEPRSRYSGLDRQGDATDQTGPPEKALSLA